MIGPLYSFYARRLRHQVMAGPLPEHVGMITDGNRRWARQMGMANPSLGHRYGAEHAENVGPPAGSVEFGEFGFDVDADDAEDGVVVARDFRRSGVGPTALHILRTQYWPDHPISLEVLTGDQRGVRGQSPGRAGVQ